MGEDKETKSYDNHDIEFVIVIPHTNTAFGSASMFGRW